MTTTTAKADTVRPFVMKMHQQIVQAIRDYNEGRLGKIDF